MSSQLISRPSTVESSRPPVLFIHGAWHGAWCWDEHFLDEFASAGYDAHALDLKAHGTDTAGLRFTGIKDFLNDVEQAVSSLSKPPVLIGHSMGGYVVQRYLETRTTPAAVLLASPPPTGAFGITLRLLKKHPLRFPKTQLQLRLWPLIATPEMSKALLQRDETSSEDAEWLHKRLQDESFRAYLGMLLRPTKLPKTISPTLVLGAAQDQIITVKELAATADRYLTEAVVLDAMSHDMMLDPDWEIAAETILTWLDKTL